MILPEEISLRPSTTNDNEFLIQVYASTRREEMASWGWNPSQQDMFVRMQYGARQRTYAGAYPSSENNIISVGGAPAGSIMIHRGPAEIRLLDISLLPAFQRRGVGGHLIGDLISEAAGLKFPLRQFICTRGSGLLPRAATRCTTRWNGPVRKAPGRSRLTLPENDLMLENLNSRIFSEQLHTTFQLRVPGAAPLLLELTEVSEENQSPSVEQFSLEFRGPLVPHIPQGTYNVEHEKLGTFDLFIVPLGPDQSGMRYQVIFSRLRQPTR